MAGRVKVSLGKDRENSGVKMPKDHFWIRDDKIEDYFCEFDPQEYDDQEFEALI